MVDHISSLCCVQLAWTPEVFKHRSTLTSNEWTFTPELPRLVEQTNCASAVFRRSVMFHPLVSDSGYHSLFTYGTLTSLRTIQRHATETPTHSISFLINFVNVERRRRLIRGRRQLALGVDTESGLPVSLTCDATHSILFALKGQLHNQAELTFATCFPFSVEASSVGEGTLPSFSSISCERYFHQLRPG
jgi:hypothetical protein